jgi:tripartite-type tricarboxylate transporter receptor subunit TctC
MRMTLTKIVSAAALILGVSIGGAIAQDYPNKPITLILPLGAGGSHDLNSRVFTSIIPQYINQAMIVKLMPGASGQTGTAAAATAPADGYTLLFSHNFFDQLQQHVKDLPYDPTKDFVTVARLNSARVCLIVRADSQFKTINELLDFGRANPGKLDFSHSGQWGAGMVPGAQLLQWAKVNANMTPYRGGGPSLKALLAGDADFTLQFPVTIQGQGDAVRTLACVNDEKKLGSPPTFASLGFEGEIGEMHRIVLAPRDIPADRLAALREAFIKLQEDKTYKRLMAKIGEDTNFMSGEEYEKIRPVQSQDYKKLVDSMTSG